MDYTAVFVLACIFIPIERLLPLHPDQPILRREWANDLVYVLVNGFMIRGAFTLVAAMLMTFYFNVLHLSSPAWIGTMPVWLQLIGAIIVADIGYYVAHRTCHAVPFLWKFHAVHHSIEQMDWLASFRVHPIDQIFSNTLSLLPLYFLGFSLEALILHQLIYQAHALFLHSNTRLTFGPLKWVLATPEYHHWHHANEREAHDRNFAAQLALIDVVAGTVFLPFKRRPKSYGLDEPMPGSYPLQFLHPFRALATDIKRHFNRESLPMPRKLEDDLGKLAMLLIFGYFAIEQIKSVVYMIIYRDLIPVWQLALFSQAVGIVFLGFVLYFTLTRLPPRDNAEGIWPRLAAVMGTFAMMMLIVLPPEPITPAMRITATTITLVGTILSIICLLRLGRSFSIMASSRQLVTSGPYGIVRHPLYASELLMMSGVALSHGSPLAFAVCAVGFTLQIRRAHYEESVLRKSFPADYADYARRVPMLIPGLKPSYIDLSIVPAQQVSQKR